MRDGSGAEPEPAPAAALPTQGLRDPETALRPNTSTPAEPRVPPYPAQPLSSPPQLAEQKNGRVGRVSCSISVMKMKRRFVPAAFSSACRPHQHRLLTV